MSKRTQKAWHKQRGQQRQRTQRSVQAKYKAMNAQVENYLTGQGGIQDRGIREQPAVFGLDNPFVLGNMKQAAHWAWLLYAGDWAAKKIVDIPAYDMYREGWDLKYVGDKPDGASIEKAIKGTEDRLKIVEKFSRANRLESALGGAAIVIIAANKEGTKPSDPLTPDMVDKGDLKCLNVVSRLRISKVDFEQDVGSPNFDAPQYYHINGDIYHESRLLIFDNNPISKKVWTDFGVYTYQQDGMGVSTYSQLWDILLRVNSYQQGLAHIAQSANVWIAARKGLKDLQAARGGVKAMSELQQMVESISMYRGYIIDGEDVKIEQLKSDVTGFSDIIMNGYDIVGAAGDIPAARFMGQAPGGLSTDDRSGLENYYSKIGADQTLFLDPKLNKLEPYILNSTFGRGVIKPDEITREYKPLWNLSESEKADIRTKDVTNISALEGANLITRANAIEELLKREAITVKPDIKELERQADEMMGMADAAGIDPERAVAEASEGFAPPSAGGIKRGMSRMLSLNAGDWDESKHSRDESGKFGRGTGDSKSSTPPRLDHGELSIPGRLKNLDREIDKFKRDEAKRKRKESKERAAEVKKNSEEVNQLLSKYGESLVQSTFEKHGSSPGMTKKAIREHLKNLARYDPKKVTAMLNKYARDAGLDAAMNASDWDEDKHPRADDGKFGKGAGDSAKDTGGSEGERPFGNTPERREELRAKFNESDPVKANSNDIRDLDKSQGVSKSLITLAVKNGAVGVHENADTGWKDIAVTKTSIRDAVFHQSGDGKIAVLMQAKDLIRNGIHVATTERNKQGQVSHVFAGKAILDGELHLVGFTVNEDKNGKRYYNHELTEIEKALGGSWPKDKMSREPSSHREPILSIVRRYLFVK